MSVHFLLPMQKEHASENALLPFLLSRACKKYPDYTKLGQRLAELYGASLSADVDKVGDVQVLSVAASGLADLRRCLLKRPPCLGVGRTRTAQGVRVNGYLFRLSPFGVIH